MVDDRIELKRQLRRQKKRRQLNDFFLNCGLIVFSGLILFLIVNKLFFSVLTVKGQSMYPVYQDGDKVWVSRTRLRSKDLKHKDIIIFKGRDEDYYIKRIIARPGELVEIYDGKVYVNGSLFEETYLTDGYTQTYNQNRWYIDKDHFFVLGDNRENFGSIDSRFFGTIDIDQVRGKVIRKSIFSQ